MTDGMRLTIKKSARNWVGNLFFLLKKDCAMLFGGIMETGCGLIGFDRGNTESITRFSMAKNNGIRVLFSSLFVAGLGYYLFFIKLPDLDLRARLIRLLLLFLLVTAMLHLLYGVVKSAPRLAPFFLCFSGLFFLFILLEAFFMFYPQTHGFVDTLASQLWNRNFRKLNIYGYRDRKYVVSDLQNKKRIFILGDSFVEGNGIKKNDDRFSDLLGMRLPEDYVVLNLGLSHSDSIDEFESLKKFPLAPHLLVLSYFGNDIEERAVQEGVSFHHLHTSELAPSFFSGIVARSWFVNYVYWTVRAKGSPDYLTYIRQVYSDPGILSAHQTDLMMMIDWCRERNIPIVVVLFPFLNTQTDSQFYIKPMTLFFEKEGIPVLSVRELMKDLDEKEWVVNKDDLHPGKKLNRRISEALYELLIAHNLIIPE